MKPLYILAAGRIRKMKWPLVTRKRLEKETRDLQRKLEYAERNFIGNAVCCPTNGTFFTVSDGGEKLATIVKKASNYPSQVIVKRVVISRESDRRYCSNLLAVD